MDEVIKLILAARDAIVRGQSISCLSEKVWTELSQQLGGKMSPKCFYTFVKLNRHNCWQILGIEADEDRESPNDDSHSTQKTCDINFELTIPYQEWTEIWQEEAVYKDRSAPSNERSYTILKRGNWSHVLNEKIWNMTKLPCTISFKRAKVYPRSAAKCIDISGHCTECNAILCIYSDTLPEMSTPAVLKCSVNSMDDSLHTGKSKRMLSGQKRVQVSEELWEGRKLPHVWRAAEAYKMMELGDPEPSHLPSLATLRKAKQEWGDKQIGHKDPILSLQLMKYSVPHNGSIHDIGLDKFFLSLLDPLSATGVQNTKQESEIKCEF